MSFADPQYRVQAFAFADSSTFGIGSLLTEITELKNLGWGVYLNDVGEAFFTLNQDDSQVTLLRGYLGKAHIRIQRSIGGAAWDTIWTGWLMETDANVRDVVFYCYSYMAGLWWLHSDWDQTWETAQIDTIVSDMWTRAKTTLTQTNVAFVTTGTIEAPVTTSGGATPIELPSYRTYYKRILLGLQELAAISQSDTNNGVVFEITHSTTPTFNLWKNQGTNQSAVVWELGGAVSNFHQVQLPIYHRNQLLAVGTPSSSAIFRYDLSDGGDITAFGRRQESLYFQWVRDQTELERVTARRLAMALREDIYLELTFLPDRVTPPGCATSTWALGDRAKVIIDRGITNINEYRLITGAQTLYVRGVEYVRAITQQRPGV